MPERGAVGWPGNSSVAYADPTRRIAVVYQADRDTTGDGRICATTDGQHGVWVGDAPRPYLIVGEGLGEPIDEFYGETGDGRYLVLGIDRRVVTVDLETGQRVVLGNESPRPRWWHLEPGPSARAGGPSMVTLRVSDHEARVIDLATGVTTTTVITSGWLYDAEVDDSGTWLSALVLDRAPSDATVPEQVPHMQTSGGPMPCNGRFVDCFGPPSHVDVFRLGEAMPSLSAVNGITLTSWGVLTAEAGQGLVALVDGQSIRIADPACEPRVLHASATAPIVAFDCAVDSSLHVARVSGREVSDLSTYVGADLATWREVGVDPFDAAWLVSLVRPSFSLMRRGAGVVERAAPPLRYVAWPPACDAGWPADTSTCVETGRRGLSTIVVDRDGHALVRRVAAQHDWCGGCTLPSGDQLLWMDVTLRTRPREEAAR